MTLSRLTSDSSAEALIAYAILDWLIDDGLVDAYNLDIEGDGSCLIEVFTTSGRFIEQHSVLGPIEAATDVAFQLVNPQ